jgi:hypothetical protein
LDLSRISRANVTAVDNTGLKRNADPTTTKVHRLQRRRRVRPPATLPKPRTALVSAALALSGDVNLDGVVDFNDLARPQSETYNQSVTGGWSDGDLNADGVVDFSDLVSLSQNYNAALPVAASPDNGTDTGELTPVDTGQLLTTITTKPPRPSPPRPNSKAVAKVFSIKPLAKPVASRPPRLTREPVSHNSPRKARRGPRTSAIRTGARGVVSPRALFAQSSACGLAGAAGPIPTMAAPPHDRATWTALAEKIARPVLTNAAAGTLHKDMPVESAPGQQANRKTVTHLEAPRPNPDRPRPLARTPPRRHRRRQTSHPPRRPRPPIHQERH